MNCLAKTGVSCGVQESLYPPSSLHVDGRTTRVTRWYFANEEFDVKWCLETMVKHCHSCQLNQHAPAKALLHPWEHTTNPCMEPIAYRLCGSFHGTRVPSGCGLATHGLPDYIVSDNGPTFTSDEFREFTSTIYSLHPIIRRRMA